jgi:Kef-type K+ transport system membrane component KefB
MPALLIVALAGLMSAARSFSPEGAQGVGGTTLAFGFVLLTAFFAGELFRRIGLPRLTGYLVAGVAIGPSGLGLVTPRMVENLGISNGVANALIALTAGSELDLRAMRALLRPIRWITLLAVPLTIVLLAAGVLAMKGILPFLAAQPPLTSGVLAVLLAVTMAAGSPAVVVALGDEMQADGPVSRVVLGSVVLSTLLVMLLFAVLSAGAKVALSGNGDALPLVLAVAYQILGSIVAGTILSMLVSVYLKRVPGGAALFLLVVAFVAAEVGRRLHFDPLLLCLAAGVFLRNATAVGARIHRDVEFSALPVYVVFFAVAGATLHLDVLLVVGLPAALLVLIRGAGLLIFARISTGIAGAPDPVRRLAGFGLLPQAGLALALALLYRDTFPEFGAEAAALVLGVVALNELIAPALYRLALVRSGEVGAARPSPAHETQPVRAGTA